MKAIEILEREHRWIGWMTEALEALVARAEAEDVLPDPAYELLLLFETFADGRHQDKEEEVLFVELLAAADERDHDLLRELLSDHGAERHYLARMRANALGALHGEADSVHEFVREAREYLKLHRAHMQRENESLLPMATRLLLPEADERAVQAFQAIEGGAGDPHGLNEQILALHRLAGLPRPPGA